MIAVALWLVLQSGGHSRPASASGRSAVPISTGTSGQTQPVNALDTTSGANPTDSLGVEGTGQPSDTSVPTQSDAPSAATEAGSIQAILTRSSAARAILARALPDLEACGAIQADIELLHSAAVTRSDLLQQTVDLPVDLLPSGSTMLADLRRALSASIVADQSYAAWGATLLSEQTCDAAGTGDPNWAAAQAADVQATSAKSAFVAAWNAVAAHFGFAPIEASQF